MILNVDPQLNQWDVGRSVSVSDSNATHIHFANQGDSKAVIIKITDGSAKIPDYLLQTGKSVIAYAVLDGVTLESKSFPVRKRERPENYIYEEDQRNYIYELVTKAETAVMNANTATTNATNAAAGANIATKNANNAAAGATDASAKANLAAQNANEATNKAANAVKSMMVVGAANGTNITLDNAIEQPFVGLRVFGKTTQNGTPTPDAPVELVSVCDGGGINTAVAGKNLLPKAVAGQVTQNGVTLYSDGNGGYILRGTSVVGTSLSFPLENRVTIPHGSYLHLFNMGVSENVALVPGFDDGTTGSVGFSALNRSVSSETYAGKTLTSLGIYLQKGYTVDITFSPMLTFNSTAEDFEPYKGQHITISTPNGLPGIPVTSGGNYTDANGQQWVCDEIDFARGVHVQRIKTYTLSPMSKVAKTDGWLNEAAFTIVDALADAVKIDGYTSLASLMSTHFKVSTPSQIAHSEIGAIGQGGGEDIFFSVSGITDVTSMQEWIAENTPTVQYILATPIETPLSAEELAAYASLHTYKDHTTISNDASAYIALEYVMDAKKYIDSMITAGILEATVE